MADEFTLPGVDDPEYEKILQETRAAASADFPGAGDPEVESFKQEMLSQYEGDQAYELPGLSDRPRVTDLPTVTKASDIPYDLLQRAKIHGQEGVDMLLTGVESLIPGTPATIWRRRQEGERALPYLASKLAPLGIVGGPVETLLSPATAVVSEIARGYGEAERRVRKLTPEQTPISQYAEEWAPLVTALATGGIGPARRGVMGLALGPGRRTAGEVGEKIVGSAQLGWRPTERALKKLEKYAPTAREVGAATRTSQMAGMEFSAMMRGGGLEEALAKMTPAQQTLFREIESGVTDVATARRTADPVTRDLIDKWQAVFEYESGLRPKLAESIGLKGKSLEGETVPFTPRPGFYIPKVYTPAGSQRIREFIEHEAEQAGRPVNIRGNIALGEEKPFIASAARARNPQAAAIAQAEEIRDIPTAALQSIEEFSKTLGRARAFGPEGERLNDMLKRISDEIGGPKGTLVAKRLYDIIKRDISAPAAKNMAADSMRVFQAVTKMPFSFISNASQSTITAVVAGARATTQAVMETIYGMARGELPELVKELGIINKTVSRSLQHEIAGGAPAWLEKTGKTVLYPFELVERFNQAVAVRAGELATNRLSAKLARTGNLAPREWRWLANSDLDVAAIQGRIGTAGGGLTQGEIRRAAWGLLDRTQFLSRPTAMPYIMRSHPLTRLIFQMKTFATRATYAIWDEVYQEAMKGNVAPLARLAVTFPIAGEAVKQVAGRARGREIEPFSPDVKANIQRGLRNMLFVGGFGIAGDAVVSASGGARRMLSFGVGPSATDIATNIESLVRIGQHRAGGPGEARKAETARKEFIRDWVKKVSFAGPITSEAMKTREQRRRTKPY